MNQLKFDIDKETARGRHLLLPVIAFFLLQREGWYGDELFTVATGLLPIGLIGALKHLQAWRRQRTARNGGTLG